MPNFVRGATGGNNGTSVTANFTSNGATNGLVVALLTEHSGNTASIVDGAVNSWSSAGFIDNATGGWRLQVWTAEDCNFSAGTNTVTVTVGMSAQNYLVIGEYSGLVLSSIVEAFISASGSGTALSSGSTAVTAGNLFIGAAYCSGGGTAAGAGFTSRETFSGLLLEDVNSTTTTNTATATATSGNWSIVGVSLVSVLAGTAPNVEMPVTNGASADNHQAVQPPAYEAQTPSYHQPVPVAAVIKQAKIGQAYSETISAEGGVSPYTYSVGAGLPTGASLNSSTGVISGTVTAAIGSYSFTMTVTDSLGQTGSTGFTIQVIPSAGGNYAYLG